MVFGALIIAAGVIALLVKTDVLSGSIWDYFWPVALVIIGLSIILGRFRFHRRWMWFCGPPWWGDRDKDRKE
ncbi:MAG: hypothetical protein A2Z15_01665 [Chloroflexi bacterium RBG_16_50_11]|nr:MAG: hypothetical protein A2Z15_01665 [Chloroflexi bacterium RBG_16_50_11]